ncbi:hypothetical protein [Mesorhizobium sp. WSM2561]|uniref:hypothetical protein n=1 Tax=Mesorhizobium sp. WSM2561 TaxID=1040985 RepID=UPI0012EB2E42|nr:hypothetical protein [Mesorhizobium sp. WSM2561]
MTVKIGDEVTLTVTILKVLDNGMSSVSIPSYSFPFSIDTPKRTRAGQKVEITGFVTRVDDEGGSVSVTCFADPRLWLRFAVKDQCGPPPARRYL